MTAVGPTVTLQPGDDLPGESRAVSTTIDRDQLVSVCSSDDQLYGQVFFPQTYRQNPPVWEGEFWEALGNPSQRLVNIIAFRGSGKTSRLRVWLSKRIAYGISRTILFVGASEDKALQSVMWLRSRMERNHFWRDTFGLRKGSKWEDSKLEIRHTVFNHTVTVLAAGVMGSLRGINFDDYRPDLIIVDDPQTDESAATESQREKLVEIVLGAVKNSLAPVVDEPNSKLVMCNTPQHQDDVSQQALRDAQWTSLVIPCWTRETLDLEVEQQVSSWPERHPTEALRADKRAALARNRLSVFAREMECRLVSRETAQFRSSWLNIREPGIAAPRGGFSVLAIDPVPPPSETQMQKSLRGKDFEAHYVWTRYNGEFHLVDFDRSRGHEPSWTIATAFRLARQHRVARIVIDAVAYQRALKWLLEQAMKSTGVYYTVVPIADGMKKFARITSVIGNLASNGKLWIGAEHTVFAAQFEAYGPTYTGHDDDLDASALALEEISAPFLERVDASGAIDDSDVDLFPLKRMSP